MKKAGKKLLALTLVSAMAFAGLAACGQGGGNTADTNAAGDSQAGTQDGGAAEQTLIVRAFAGGNGTEIWEKIAAAFEEANEGVSVDLETSSELDQDLTKIFKMVIFRILFTIISDSQAALQKQC